MKLSNFQKLTAYTLIKLSKNNINFWKRHAYSLNAVNDVIDKKHSDAFFVYKYLGEGFPYIAQFLYYLDNIDDSGTGARVLITIPNGMSIQLYLGRKDIRSL